MALKGKAKTEYQREYMRHKRAGLTIGSNKPKTVRIEGKEYIVPELDADGNVVPSFT